MLIGQIIVGVMARKNSKKSYRKDLIESLKAPEEAIGYLKACLDEKDMPEVFLAALRDVAEARGIGMSQLARDTNLNPRGSLHDALKAG